MNTSRILLLAFALATGALGCGDPGDDTPNNPPIPPSPPWDGGDGGAIGDYGVSPDTAPPSCADDLKRCPATFSYPFSGESSVELRGDHREDGWTVGDAMKHEGSSWKVTVPVPYGKPVQYKFVIDTKTWVLDPGNPSTITDSSGITNSLLAPSTCSTFTCADPPTPPAGVFDWRDAVIYFVFVDRFLDGDPSNNGPSISGVASPGAYQGGDFAGVTKKITDGYFTDLGVNTLWITVPVQNADDIGGLGVGGDSHLYSAYHGYWPRDLEQIEKRFGTKAELKALVDAAHTSKIKVLFDYAMVHVHVSSPTYSAHKDWFWPATIGSGESCICGSSACPWDSKGDRCWFTDYLPHWNYTVAEARDYSVSNAVQLVKDTGADGFRLDAIKHVDGTWLTQLRARINSEIVAKTSPPQRFYMVGETYDFGNRDFIKSFVDPSTKLDGQFDFPLRLHIVQSVLMRQKGMDDLAGFMDSNDGFYGPAAVMSTFVGNHDLPRSIHVGENTPMWDNPYSDGKDRSWSSMPTLPTAREPFERLASAFAVILTNKGAPLIYYGDEIGLPGAGDPDNRRMMSFGSLTADQTFLKSRVKALTAIRAAHPAMRRGTRKTLSISPDVWLYSMSTSGDTVYVAINRSDSERTVSLPAGTYTELVEGGSSTSIPARQTRIWIAK